MVTFGVDLAVLLAAGWAAGAAPLVAACLALAVVCVMYLGGGYAERSTLETQGVLWFVSALAMPVAVTLLGAVALAQVVDWPVPEILLAGVMGLGGLVAVRVVTWTVLALARRRGLGLQRTLIVGDAQHAPMLAKKLADSPEVGLLPVAVVAVENGNGNANGNGSGQRSGFLSAEQLSRAIEEASAEHVVLAPHGTDKAILECVRGSEGLDVSFSMLPPLSELFLNPGMVAQVGGLPLIPLTHVARGRTSLPGKRIFDLVCATMILMLLTPVLAVTALAIQLFDGGPVLYRQRRVGRNSKVFQMLKLRSMVNDAERLVVDLRDRNVSNGLLFKVHEDPRVTGLGRIIRRLSIDELPQLWNVIRGDMSLVGPRPLAVAPEDFNAIDNKRHSVRPGITGYWQVSGDNALSYEEMVKLDLAYVENWSLWLDVRLLFRTIPALVRRRGPS